MPPARQRSLLPAGAGGMDRAGAVIPIWTMIGFSAAWTHGQQHTRLPVCLLAFIARTNGS